MGFFFFYNFSIIFIIVTFFSFFLKSLQMNNHRGISGRNWWIIRKFKKRRCPPVNVRFVDSSIKQTSEELLLEFIYSPSSWDQTYVNDCEKIMPSHIDEMQRSQIIWIFATPFAYRKFSKFSKNIFESRISMEMEIVGIKNLAAIICSFAKVYISQILMNN